MTLRLVQRSETLEGLLKCCIAIYGMGTLILFVTRSGFLNLFHPIVPCCLLLTVESCCYSRQPGRPDHSLLARAGPIAVIGTLWYLLAWQQFHPHFGLLDETTIKHAARQPSPRFAMRQRWSGLEPWLKEWRSEHKTVALLGTSETGCLVAADMPPYWRYSPLCEQLFFWGQVDELRTALRQNPPDVAVIAAPGTGEPGFHDVLESLREELKHRFRLESKVNDLEIYYRN